LRKSLGTISLTLFIGFLIGAILGQVIGLFITDQTSVAYKLFVKSVDPGLPQMTWNLVVVEITFGIQFKFNFMSVVGAFIATQFMRWYR